MPLVRTRHPKALSCPTRKWEERFEAFGTSDSPDPSYAIGYCGARDAADNQFPDLAHDLDVEWRKWFSNLECKGDCVKVLIAIGPAYHDVDVKPIERGYGAKRHAIGYKARIDVWQTITVSCDPASEHPGQAAQPKSGEQKSTSKGAAAKKG